MKRVLMFVFAVVLTAAVLCGLALPVASAESVVEYAGNPYKAFDYFATNFSNRTVGQESERGAANWLANRLADMGYTSVLGSTTAADMLQAFDFSYEVSSGYYSTDTVKEKSYNVVAYKRSGNADAPLLVIAAPYSNEKQYVYDGETLNFEDAGYSASSVGVLLSVAADLAQKKLNGGQNLSYDVAFAFMGAEYFYMSGTDAFINANKQTLLGVIYLTEVGVGDELNIYYDEVTRTHGTFIDNFIAKFDYPIEGKPFDPAYGLQVYGGDLPYSHIGMSGGNYLFMQEGVPAVHLFGYHWDGFQSSESTVHGDIVYTTNDTKENFVKLYGEDRIKARLELAESFITTLVYQDADLVAAFEGARQDASYKGLVSNTLYQALRWGLVGFAVLCAVVVALLLWRRSKNAGTPDFSVNSEFINGTPDDAKEDIFAEYGSIRGEEGAVDTENPADKGDDTGTPPDTNDIFGEF